MNKYTVFFGPDRTDPKLTPLRVVAYSEAEAEKVAWTSMYALVGPEAQLLKVHMISQEG
jgi:hypothetical protein